MELENKIYEFMKKFAVSPAGDIIIKYWGKVENVEKQSDIKDPGSTAKTVIDEVVQELFLADLYKIAPNVRINVEEKTTLKFLFKDNSGMVYTMIIHQDPCDGTLSYVNKTERFSTGYAISDKNNNFTHTVIYVPAKKTLYFASPDEFGIRRFLDGKQIEFPILEERSKRIYNKRILSEKGITQLEKAGFYVEEVHCSHLCILETASGLAGAFLYEKSNIHDSMIPYAFAKKCNAQLVNANGNFVTEADMKINIENGFIKFERLPSVCYFSANAVKDGQMKEILGVLANKENLNTGD